MNEYEKYKKMAEDTIEDCQKKVEMATYILNEVYKELEEAKEELDKIELEKYDEQTKELVEERSRLQKLIIQKRAQINANLPDSAFKSVVKRGDETQEETHYTNTPEYRKAFMRFVQTGEIGDALKKRSGTQTFMADIESVIVPHTITDQIIEKMQSYGQIWSRITKTNYAAGLNVPTSEFGENAEWIWDATTKTSEGKTADGKKKPTGVVSFQLFKCQVKVPVSLEASVSSLAVFEQKIVENNAIKIVRAIEKAVISGTGGANGQPAGIITATGTGIQTKTMTNADLGSYQKWVETLGLVPLAYSNRVKWVFNKGDYYTYILGMVDANGQPVARTNKGLHGVDNHVFLGREVVLVEDYGLAAMSGATGVVGFLFDLADYWFNSNMAMTYRKYFDEDTDMYYHKSTLLGDGKIVSPYSLVKITKASA